ncbi:parvulin-like peptidyl-prolyl isomerase [Roseimicrobium gellanilyticum]|uniref:peptidylprolyl isomerase n=1 Tax=Roseimicrobium gellanilyticum TaxID=748857 RepID=A0A366H6A2_9BACT|nr:peptidyl-prolyl cis-trans isomerase [Roseimicrobium gellanilyticum]RBP37649.1 parvulin-like peptidyl-prolyl isomerase [Roseimicrobium gellanilyticum]
MALIVNGEEIEDETIENEFRTIKGHYERTLQVACCERDPEFRALAKDNLASRLIIQQEAMKRFPEVSTEDVKSRLAKLIEESGSEDQFLMRIGMPVKDEGLLHAQVSNGVRMDKMMIAVYAPEPTPTDEDMRAWYEKNIQYFLTEEEVKASHITLSLAGARSRAEVYTQVRELRGKALAGADFDALAVEHNSNKETPPDLGWFKRGEFMEEFECIAFSMNEGEVSPVFTTQLGFHICKLTGRKPAVPKPFDDVKDEVRHRMLEQHRDEKFNVFVDELKKAASIEDTDPDEGCGCGH